MYDEELITGLADILADEGCEPSTAREYADMYLSATWEIEERDLMVSTLTAYLLEEYDTPEEATGVAEDLADWISQARSAIQ